MKTNFRLLIFLTTYCLSGCITGNTTDTPAGVNIGELTPAPPSEGVNTEFFPNGSPYKEYELRDGLKEGVEREYFEDGNLRFERNYARNILNGIAKQFYPNGQIAAQIFYVNGVMEGVARYFHPNGAAAQQCRFVRGLIEGEVRAQDNSGRLWSTLKMRRGVPTGELRILYPNGRIEKIAVFRAGAIDWPVKSYTRTGQLIENVTCAEREKPVCTSSSYNQSVVKSVEFQFTTPETRTKASWNFGDFEIIDQMDRMEFHATGYLLEKIYFSDRQKNGWFREYAGNGAVKRECQVVNDEFTTCETP